MYQTSLNRAKKIVNLLLSMVGNSDSYITVKYNNTMFENIKHYTNEECYIFLSKSRKVVEYYPNSKFDHSEFIMNSQLFSYSRKNTSITLRSNNGEIELIDISDFNEELYFQYSTVYEQPVLDALVLFSLLKNEDAPYLVCLLNEMEEIENEIRRLTLLDR